MFKLIFFVLISHMAFANHSQTYFIKGMVCGECVEKIKGTLDRSSHLNIVQSQVEVGSVILKTKKEEKSLNCKVVRAIEGATEYKVFLDKEYLKPACAKS